MSEETEEIEEVDPLESSPTRERFENYIKDIIQDARADNHIRREIHKRRDSWTGEVVKNAPIYLVIEDEVEHYHPHVIRRLAALGRSSSKELAKIRQEAIDRGHAQYNPKTGKWEWKEEKHD